MRLSQPLFMLTAVATTAFVITILAMIAMLLGDPDAPVNVWFNNHGATVMTFEVISIALFGFSAMIADSREMRQKQQKEKSPPKSSA
jgi:succinate dehydrogenase hydrophobic anchor subunit